MNDWPLKSSKVYFKMTPFQKAEPEFGAEDFSAQAVKSLFQRWRHLTSAKVLSEQSVDNREGWR